MDCLNEQLKNRNFIISHIELEGVMKKLLQSIMLFSFLFLFQCSNHEKIEGNPSQWLKGKSITVKVEFMINGFELWLRNDTDTAFNMGNMNIAYYNASNDEFIVQPFPGDVLLDSKKIFVFPTYGSGDETVVIISIKEKEKIIEEFIVTVK